MKGLILIIMLLITSTISAKPVMRINYFDKYPPYSWKDGNVMTGILVDIATEALSKRMGIKVIHQGFPWARAQERVQKQKGGDAFITVPTPKRREYTLISKETVLPVTFSILVNKKNKKLNDIKRIKQLSDLKEFQLISYLGNGWARLKLGKMNILWVPSIERVLQLLDKNRYDLFVEATLAIDYYVSKLNYDANLMSIKVPFTAVQFHLCIGKHSTFADIMPKFDETIRLMQKDGTLEKIYKKYR